MAKADPVGGSHKASQGRDLVRRHGFAPAKLRAKADAVGNRAGATYPTAESHLRDAALAPLRLEDGLRPLADSPSRGE